MITQGLGWDSVKTDLVQSYAGDFTVAELKEVTAFYHTPVGQKLVEKQPALTEKLGKTLQQRSMALIPTIRQKIQAANAKAHPTPSPVPVASPAGSPAGVVSPALPLVVPPHPSPVTTAPVPVAPAEGTASPEGTPKSVTPVLPATPAPR